MTANKFIRAPLWTALVAALVAAMAVAFFVFVQTGEAAQVADSKNYEPQMIDGEPVPNGKYPFLAALLDTRTGNTPSDQHFCGGTLIDKDSVLTAAHCVDEELLVPGVQLMPTAPLRVIVGRTVLSSKQGKVRNVKKIFAHPNYQGLPTTNYDAAVLDLSRPVLGIAPIKLASSKQDNLEKPGRKATVAGWGSTTARQVCPSSDVSPSFPNRMRKAQVPIISDSRADQLYQDICQSSGLRSKYTPQLMVAAGGTGKGVCEADSGGPLFVGRPSDDGDNGDGDNGGSRRKYTQIGISSFGAGCGSERYPDAYTEVNNPSIRSVIKSAASK
jgi:secreted trypsin-like serine protease